MSPLTVAGTVRTSPDWELDYYSRPILEADGKKRWELLICASEDPQTAQSAHEESPGSPFRWVRDCPAASVNSVWLREALEAALADAAARGFGPPRRVRCMRGSMRPMVQRASEGLGIELVASRRCYSLLEWLREREAGVYPQEPGYMAGPLAPPPAPIQAMAVPLPEAVRGENWSWASLPASMLAEASGWDVGFGGLLPLPPLGDDAVMVPGIRLFSRERALAIAGWLAGLEPVRLEICGKQLVLEAGLEDRWLLATLPEQEARAASEALAAARSQAGGLQFIAVQATEAEPRLEGFWMLRDLPDG
jgi:hypothetical protein